MSIQRFEVEPAVVEAGQSAILSWSVSGATDVSISPVLGDLERERLSGQRSRTVTALQRADSAAPRASTSDNTLESVGQKIIKPIQTIAYTLTAKGDTGTVSTVVSIRVTQPQKDLALETAEDPALSDLIAREVVDILFEGEEANPDERGWLILTQNAKALIQILGSRPNAVIVSEGNTDQRGSGEYNLALSALRAANVKTLLVKMGVPADRLMTIGLGAERLECADATFECFRRNNRVHFVPAAAH